MIKLLPLLLVFSLAYGQNINYLLPEQNSLLTHRLEEAFKHSHDRILIITPAFNHTLLKHAALKNAKRGSRLILIVQELKSGPLELAQYARVDIRTLPGRTLEGSIIIVDDILACTFPGRIDEKSLSQNASLIRCSDDAPELTALHNAFWPLVKRSKAYLE